MASRFLVKLVSLIICTCIWTVWTWAFPWTDIPNEATQDCAPHFCFRQDRSNRSQGDCSHPAFNNFICCFLFITLFNWCALQVRDETYTAFENIYPVLTEFRKSQQWYVIDQNRCISVVFIYIYIFIAGNKVGSVFESVLCPIYSCFIILFSWQTAGFLLGLLFLHQ